jgi:hypothetical protein
MCNAGAGLDRRERTRVGQLTIVIAKGQLLPEHAEVLAVWTCDISLKSSLQQSRQGLALVMLVGNQPVVRKNLQRVAPQRRHVLQRTQRLVAHFDVGRANPSGVVVGIVAGQKAVRAIPKGAVGSGRDAFSATAKSTSRLGLLLLCRRGLGVGREKKDIASILLHITDCRILDDPVQFGRRFGGQEGNDVPPRARSDLQRQGHRSLGMSRRLPS